MYLACAVAKAAERGSYGEAGERGVLMEDMDPEREVFRNGRLIFIDAVLSMLMYILRKLFLDMGIG